MTPISTDSMPLMMLDRSRARRGESSRPLRVRPFREVTLPRPKDTPSGLFPAVPVRPGPPVGGALRLRRAVALTVVLGTVGLLAYASWQRVAHARELVEHTAPTAGHGAAPRL
jgi:hypothetical protein